MALGKPDHPGEVRGQPFGVGLRRYFGSQTATSHRSEAREADMAKMRQELEATLTLSIEERIRKDLEAKMEERIEERMEIRMSTQMEQMQSMMAWMLQDAKAQVVAEYVATQSLATPRSTKGSNIQMRRIPFEYPLPTDGDDGAVKATLCLEDPRPRVVAHARIFLKARRQHNTSISDDCNRVSITGVIEGEEQTALPIPERGEVEVLGEAIDNFILWPKRLIGSVSQGQPLQDVQNEKTPYWNRFRRKYRSFRQTIFRMPHGVVHPNFAHEFYMKADDYTEFVMMNDLDLSWLVLAIMFFHDCCVDHGRRSLYGFFCPSFIAPRQYRLESRRNHMTQTMQETNCQCYLAPVLKEYNGRGHWTLCVLLPHSHQVFWLCSARFRVPTHLKEQFNVVLRIHRMYVLQVRDNKDPAWASLKVPRQKGGHECGLYVIYYIYTIIQSGEVSSQGIKNLFGDTDPLLDTDLNFIRDLIASKWFTVAIQHWMIEYPSHGRSSY